MELPRAIVNEAQRMHQAAQSKLLLDAMCFVECQPWRGDEVQEAVRSVYMSQRSQGQSVIIFPERDFLPYGTVVDCNDQTLAGLAGDWAHMQAKPGCMYKIVLHRHMNWNAALACFNKQYQLMERVVSTMGKPPNEDSCLAGLKHFSSVVAAMRPYATPLM